MKSMTLLEVQNQNRFQIEDGFLNFIQEQLDEQKITSFVETLSNHADFLPFVEKWLSSDEEE